MSPYLSCSICVVGGFINETKENTEGCLLQPSPDTGCSRLKVQPLP